MKTKNYLLLIVAFSFCFGTFVNHQHQEMKKMLFPKEFIG
jgi:hypothetical protein